MLRIKLIIKYCVSCWITDILQNDTRTIQYQSEAFYFVHFSIKIIFLISELNAHVQLNILFTKCMLHVSALTGPSSGRTLYHFSKPSAYCKVVTVAELQSVEYIICGLFTKLQLLNLTSGFYKRSGILEKICDYLRLKKLGSIRLVRATRLTH